MGGALCCWVMWSMWSGGENHKIFKILRLQIKLCSLCCLAQTVQQGSLWVQTPIEQGFFFICIKQQLQQQQQEKKLHCYFIILGLKKKIASFFSVIKSEKVEQSDGFFLKLYFVVWNHKTSWIADFFWPPLFLLPV